MRPRLTLIFSSAKFLSLEKQKQKKKKNHHFQVISTLNVSHVVDGRGPSIVLHSTLTIRMRQTYLISLTLGNFLLTPTNTKYSKAGRLKGCNQ